MEDEDNDKPWNFHTCKSCPYRSRSVFVMCQHVQQHRRRPKIYTFQCESNAPETLQCEHCLFETDLKVRLQHHISDNHEEKEENVSSNNALRCHKCKDCALKTYSLLVMLKHIRNFNHVVDKDFTEDRERKKKSFRCDSSTPEKFKCKHCAFETDFKVRLQHHLNVRHKEKENLTLKSIMKCYKCKICNFQTYSQLVMTEHMDSMGHVIDENIIEVQSQHKKFAKSEHWIYGQNDREDIIVKFKRGQCSFSTKFKPNLRRHVLFNHFEPVIRDVHWYKCKNCSFQTQVKNALTRHISLKHHNAMNFKCDQCSFKTVSKHSLRRHISSKHWFDCPHCLVKTTTMDRLIKHISLRHNDRTYRFVCDYCPYLTHREDYFRTHIFFKHFEKVKWFECQRCSFKTKISHRLTTHMHLCKMGVKLFCWQQ